MRETLAGVTRVAQPSPARNPGGDCFACALIATLRHLCPERPAPTFDDTDRWFEGQWATPTDKPPPTDNTWPGIQRAVDRARFDGWPVEKQIDMVMPQFDPERWGYCWPIQWGGRSYARRLEAWVAAGWIALTNVLYDGAGPITPDLKIRSGDHFVALDGVREAPDDPYWNNPELHVVCSARGDYWIDTMTWERGYGGAPWLLVRRSDG